MLSNVLVKLALLSQITERCLKAIVLDFTNTGVYQHVCLPTRVFNTCVYQRMCLPKHVFTNACVYQHMCLPTHVLVNRNRNRKKSSEESEKHVTIGRRIHF